MGKNKEKRDKHRNRKGPGSAAAAAKDQAEVDEETALQVKEIEERLQGIMAEVKSIENSIRVNTMEAKRAQLTCVELQPMPEDAKIYRQVGKMFLLQPKAELATALQATNALKNVEIQQLKQAHTKLEVKMKSEAEGLRELLGPEKMRQLFAKSGGSSEDSAKGGGGAPPSGTVKVPEDGLMPLWGSRPDGAGAAAAATAGDPTADDAHKADAGAADAGDVAKPASDEAGAGEPTP